jgi:hypothetical protein
MKRRRSKIRIAVNGQSVLSLFILLAMLIQPMDLFAAGAACTPPGHDCCEHLQGPMSATCPVSAMACSLTCSQRQSATFVVKLREAAGRAELQSTPLNKTVVPALHLSVARAKMQFFSLPVSPPLTPLSQTCLLLI